MVRQSMGKKAKFTFSVSSKTKITLATIALIVLVVFAFFLYMFTPISIVRFPLEEKWKIESTEDFPHHANAYSRPVIGDVNNDGYLDVVAMISKDPKYNMIVAVDGLTGNIIWNYNLSKISVQEEALYMIFFRVSNLDQDSKLETVIWTSLGDLYILDDDGSPKNITRVTSELIAVYVADCNEDYLSDLILVFNNKTLIFNNTNLRLIKAINLPFKSFFTYLYYKDGSPHLVLNHESTNWSETISISLTENKTDWIISNASIVIYGALTGIVVDDIPYLIVLAYHPPSMLDAFLAVVNLIEGKIVNKLSPELGYSLRACCLIMDVNEDNKDELILVDSETREGILGTNYYTWLVALTIPNGELMFREKIEKEGDWDILNKINLASDDLPFIVLLNTEVQFEPVELGIYSIEELKLITSIKIKNIMNYWITVLTRDIDNDEIDELIVYSAFQGILVAYDINI